MLFYHKRKTIPAETVTKYDFLAKEIGKESRQGNTLMLVSGSVTALYFFFLRILSKIRTTREINMFKLNRYVYIIMNM